MVGLDGVDDISRARIILMDIVGREKVSTPAGGIELFVERAVGVGSDGRDELGRLPFCSGDQRRDGVSCFCAAHCGRQACVREIRLVEGQHPLRRVGAVHHVDSSVDISGEGHHRDEAIGCVRRSGSAGNGGTKSKPIVRGSDGVEHGGVHAPIEGYSFHERWAA